ncbi:hypothetical protein [Sphingomonas xanthus]|uniref:Helix-turn-helix transcriptional regulator n=1 Tax=Sphingomonas xanthus TaxID=2594473 RepID=A0A516IQ35_9SPHN|nr:hypothetical protein [Sphingomonas xanthus]QDP19021.1 hypothetical protein FMM02_03030 [Sphingomonas xanthus]
MNAPFEEDGWKRAMELVAGATGSGAVHLAAIGGPMMMPLDIFVGREAHRVDEVFSAPELCGEGNWRLRAVGDLMTIQHERHYAEARKRGGTSAYDDAVSMLDMQLGCQSTLISDQHNFLGLALIRGRREGATDDVVYGRFAHLLHHVQRAVRVQLAMDGEAAEVMLGELATVDCRVILLDRHGCLSAVSSRAEALLDEVGPARLEGLSVALRNRDENRQLHQAMGRLLAKSAHAPVVHQMRAGRTACAPHGRWKLSLIRLPDRPHGLGFDPALAISFQPLAQQPAAFEAGQALH